MEREEDIIKFLGKSNHEIVKTSIVKGRLDKDKVYEIGLKIDKSLGEADTSLTGVFKAQHRSNADVQLLFVWKKMLDAWMTVVEEDTEMDGAPILKKALKDCGEHALAGKIQMDANNVSLESNIPFSHPNVPPYIEEQTAKPPTVDLQIKDTCASHGVGKAIQARYDDDGYETDQDAITDALKNEVQCNGEAKNPSEFHGKKIKVAYSKNGRNGEDIIELVVKTQWGVFDRNNLTFQTEPIVGPEAGWKTVVRWDIGMSLEDGKSHGPHAIYAESYDSIRGVFNCINSWGQNNFSKPKIHKSRIYAVDYISICKVKTSS